MKMNIKYLIAILAATVLALPSAIQAEEAATDTAAAVSETTADATAATMAEAVPEESDYKWGASCELGFDLSEGNASTRNLLGNCSSEHAISIWKISLMGSVQYGIARFGGSDSTDHGEFVENANYWMAGIKEEVFLDDSNRLSLFAVESISSNHFAGYWVRKAVALGAGYAYFSSDTQNHGVEAGFNYDHDSLVSNNADGERSESRYALLVAFAGDMKLGAYVSGNYSVSWSPNLLEFADDSRIDGAAGVTIQLAENLAYKIGAKLAWDQAPGNVAVIDPATGDNARAKSLDTTLSNLLVVTFR